MVNYAYLKKIKTNGNLPVAIIHFINFVSNFIDATYFRFKNGDIREGQNIAVKSQFSSEIGYLYNFSVVFNKNVSNAYHFQEAGAFK